MNHPSGYTEEHLDAAAMEPNNRPRKTPDHTKPSEKPLEPIDDTRNINTNRHHQHQPPTKMLRQPIEFAQRRRSHHRNPPATSIIGDPLKGAQKKEAADPGRDPQPQPSAAKAKPPETEPQAPGRDPAPPPAAPAYAWTAYQAMPSARQPTRTSMSRSALFIV